MDSGGSLTVDEEVAALSRSADRDSLFMQADLIVPGEAAPVPIRVRNLSSGGMLVQSPLRVAAAMRVKAVLRNIGTVPGHVVWVGEGKFGIAFEVRVNPQAVRRQITYKADELPHITVLNRGPSYRRR